MGDIVSKANMSGECAGVTIRVSTVTTMQVGSREGRGELGTDTGRAGDVKVTVGQRLQWL